MNKIEKLLIDYDELMIELILERIDLNKVYTREELQKVVEEIME